MPEKNATNKQISLVVSAGSIISLLLGLNAWFLSRLVETLDSTTKAVVELKTDVAVLKWVISHDETKTPRRREKNEDRSP